MITSELPTGSGSGLGPHPGLDRTDLKIPHIMAFTLDSSDFMRDFNTKNPKTPTKQHKTAKTTLSQLFMSSPDLLGSQNTMKPAQRTILKSKKRKITASPMLEQLSSDNQDSQDNQSSDRLLQQVRKHLKQALQQLTNPTVQLELENSIKSLDQARFFANLDSLKQPEEVFHEKPDVQEQLDDFKKEVNSKLDQVLQQVSQTKAQTAEKPTFVFTQSPKTNTTTSRQSTLANTAKPATYASVASNKEQNSQKPWTTVQKKTTKPKVVEKPISFRERRLVMKPKTPTTTINAIDMRNKVNNALKTAKIDNLLVSTVAISQSGASIVFTTSEGTAEDLLKHQHVWNSLFDFTEIKKDEKWYKIVAHGIPTAIFNIKEGMQLVKDEVEIFNKDIKLAILPH